MTVSRRTLLHSAAAAGVAAAVTRPGSAEAAVTPTGTTVPPEVARLGFDRVLFTSRFTDLSTIDMDQTGRAGYDWYTNYTWDGVPARPWYSYYTVQDAALGPVLEINPKTYGAPPAPETSGPPANNCNWNISTMDPKTAAGKAFRYGYFEVRARFTTPAAPVWAEGQPAPATNWPSMWLASRAAVIGTDLPAYGEIDIHEALAGPGKISEAVHQWPGRGSHATTSHYSDGFYGTMPAGWTTQTWHTYAVAWLPGLVEWYVDGVKVARRTDGRTVTPHVGETGFYDELNQWTAGVHTSPQSLPKGTFTCLDRDFFTLIIGTGDGNPMDVAAVNVYGSPASVLA